MRLHIFGDPVVFLLGPVPVTGTMLVSAAVSVALVVAAGLLARRVVRGSHDDWAILAILAVEWLDELVRGIVGRDHPRVATLAGTLFLFIAACNLAGQLPGLRPATGSLATTSALAAVVFLAVPVAGIVRHGLAGYLGHYVRPNPLFLPLHLISELSRTIALAVRLFGNIMSGHLVVGLLVALAGFLVPTPMMALDVLIGLLQAYIFTVLATVYIGAALGAEEGA
ncbi:MAG: F0F1 ATP synthase subunit A [Thermodesulfobacteriota bacterium]